MRPKSAAMPTYMHPTQSYAQKAAVPVNMKKALYVQEYVLPYRKTVQEKSKYANWDSSTKLNGNSLVKEEKISDTHTAPLDYQKHVEM